MFNTSSVLARLEGTGTVTTQTAREIGLVGVAARASGLSRDVRHSFPYGIYRFCQLPMCTWSTGDCFARAYVRWLEVHQSIRFIREQLQALPPGPIDATVGALSPDSLVVSLTEGWRGEICHVARTDGAGRFSLYKIVDPSFHNWFGLACSLRNQAISDFPLCNKSCNLSYCGHDL
jgi:Ni,Fe-hydrogenase III large subunit